MTVASDFFEDIKDHGFNLYCRWQDEKEYEDIEDYRKAFIKAATEHAVEIGKMTKRPFGFEFFAEDKKYKFKVTGSSVSYKQFL